MRTVFALIKRNRQLFFRDKGMLISSLITPIILIVLYATFLQNVYKDSLQSALPGVMNVSEKLVNGTVAGQLAAALLAVSCVTVTFCVNLTMIQDKASGARKDFLWIYNGENVQGETCGVEVCCKDKVGKNNSLNRGIYSRGQILCNFT